MLDPYSHIEQFEEKLSAWEGVRFLKKLVSDPKYSNRFFPKSNCFSNVHNREVSERRKTKKLKLAEAKQKAEAQETASNRSEKPVQPALDNERHFGPPPKIISGSKRSVWAGSGERSAVRAWDAGDRSWR